MNSIGSKTKISPKNTSRQKAWTSMRVMREFTTASLQMTAEIKERNCREFVQRLHAAGFLSIVKEGINGSPSGKRTRYRLVINKGPLAPIPWKNGKVYDPNTDTEHGEVSDGR